MSYTTFNPFAIVVAAVVAFALGYLWYAVLFEQAWLRLNGHAGKTVAQLAAMRALALRAYAVSFVAFLLMGASLSVLADYIVLDTVPQALKLAALVFVGFVAPVGAIATAYAERPWLAWLLDAGYQGLYLAVMSVVVVLWL